MKEYAIIVAGGKGTRLKSSVPKQFLLLAGQPILLHTIEAFYRYSEKITVILVLPETDWDTWNAIVRDYHFLRPVILQQGGDSRFQSVKRGLEKIDGDGLVAIHDGVRPLINTSIIASSFQLAATHKSAVAAMPLKESIRMTDGETSKAMDRSRYQLIQTPQTFDVSLIQSAYRVTEEATLTDDASVAERSGHTIYLFEGSYENIKITTPEDLIIAEALMAARQC
ncbi:MAG: 2-C-methyl-D-erythritol 4-phosphate cytidylyltransferase [Cytophaga sp.]|nr:2-C-methyl-D-erythritol 4-phosphate cytidylyltransferase [Cytophaga sp.]